MAGSVGAALGAELGRWIAEGVVQLKNPSMNSPVRAIRLCGIEYNMLVHLAKKSSYKTSFNMPGPVCHVAFASPTVSRRLCRAPFGRQAGAVR